jgi:hypothetical protein
MSPPAGVTAPRAFLFMTTIKYREKMKKKHSPGCEHESPYRCDGAKGLFVRDNHQIQRKNEKKTLTRL